MNNRKKDYIFNLSFSSREKLLIIIFNEQFQMFFFPCILWNWQSIKYLVFICFLFLNQKTSSSFIY